MNFYWIYDISIGAAFAIIVGFFTLYGMAGLFFAQKTFHKKLGYSHDRNEQVSFYMAAIGVFYGITLGLVAVGTWENFELVQERASKEAATLGALYRDVSSFPEPKKKELQAYLKEYTRYVIEEAWPLQQQGIVPKGGVVRLNDFQDALYSFEPKDKREEIVFAETLRIYNDFITMRRLRLMSVDNGIPIVIWIVTIVGALVSISFFWFFVLEHKWVQDLLTSVLAFFIGTMIFLITMMDNPFRGRVSVTADSFVMLYEQMMK